MAFFLIRRMEIYKFTGQGHRYAVRNDEETKDTEILIKIAVLFYLCKSQWKINCVQFITETKFNTSKMFL